MQITVDDRHRTVVSLSIVSASSLSTLLSPGVARTALGCRASVPEISVLATGITLSLIHI
eukprot:4822660-Pyramimonas_sp.AAC.1